MKKVLYTSIVLMLLLSNINFAQKPRVVNLDEVAIKNYLDNNALDEIEGIWKAYNQESYNSYTLGIIKEDAHYIAIIITSEDKWKSGEIKAQIDLTSIKNVFSVKWGMGDKKTIREIFGNLESAGLLIFNFGDTFNGDSSYIRLYPLK